jgi:tetratricopeptide (TPR) repeat protein
MDIQFSFSELISGCHSGGAALFISAVGTSQKNQPTSGGQAAPAAIEQRVRDFLAAGRYRKARDEIKPLCKIDRAKYLPLLIQANQGLAKEMLAKGQVSEAEQVIAYLKTIASPAELRALEVEMAVKSNEPAKVMAGSLPLLADPTASLAEPERRRLADHLVLTFQSPQTNDPGTAQLVAEIESVQAALQAVANQQFDQAQELLRALPHRSIVSPWKLFIKGLIAFYRQDQDRAAEYFTSLPAGSAAAKASQPFLVLAGKQNGADRAVPPSAATTQAICKLAGLTGLGPVLDQAERLWRAERYVDSYQALRRAVAGFPSENPDALGALSGFFFKVIFGLPGTVAEDYALYFEDLEFDERNKNPAERLLTLRMLALFGEKIRAPSELRLYWEGFVDLHGQLHGANPRLASLVFGYLGKVLSAPRPPSPYYGQAREVLVDSSGAIECLQKSIALDPANLEAHLALSQVFETLKMASERNRLLDAMSERFPDNKAVLVLAGRRCLEREAYVKGLDYLQQAFEVDRLDPAIPDLLVFGKSKLAQQAYEKGRLDKARLGFAALSEYLVDDPMNFARGRWGMFIREGVLELLFGDHQRGQDLLGQARNATVASVFFLFFAETAYRLFQPKGAPVFPFERELGSAAKDASAVRAASLLRIYQYWLGVPNVKELYREEEWLGEYLRKAIRHPFTRDEALVLVETAGPQSVFKDEIYPFIEKVLKQDRNDPLFRLLHHILQPFSLDEANDAHSELESIIAEATRRGDERTVKFARQCMAKLEVPRRAPVPFEPPFVEEEEEFVEDEPWSGNVSAPTPNDLAMMDEMLALINQASDAEIREFRKKLPKGMPKEVFDLLVAGTRNGMPLPPLPVPPARPGPRALQPPKSEPPEIDTNQLELF